MTFPDENSTIEEIENFKPCGFGGCYFWNGGRKAELLKYKKSKLARLKFAIRKHFPEKDALDKLFG